MYVPKQKLGLVFKKKFKLQLSYDLTSGHLNISPATSDKFVQKNDMNQEELSSNFLNIWINITHLLSYHNTMVYLTIHFIILKLNVLHSLLQP